MDEGTKDQEPLEPDGLPGEPDTIPEGDDDELSTVKAQPIAPRMGVGEVLLGRYEVVGSLGRGAMGMVLRCLDRISAVDVAVKALPPELSHNAAEMADIRVNFQLIHRLHHPHIAGINVLDQDPNSGYYFLIMEYVEGVSLNTHRKDRGGTLSLEETSQIVTQVADALDYAHSKKVIHRDIKPANIMVQPDGSTKVLDFGIAAQLHTSMTRVSRHRYSSSGTAPYMAPEQWEGDFQNESTDQYALAVTAYEMLAGRRPFGSHDLKVMMAAVLYKDAARIEGLPNHAWRALKKALAKDRRRRFATCSDFADALAGKGAARAGAVPPWKRVAAAALMAVSLMCVGVVIYRLHASKRAAEIARQKVAAELDAMRRRDLARKHVSLGDIYSEASQFGDALKSYRLAELSDPSFPGLMQRIAKMKAELTALENARKKTEDEQQQLRLSAQKIVREAISLREAGKLEAAAARYISALKLLPGDADIAKSVQTIRKEIEEKKKADEAERRRLAAARTLGRRQAAEAKVLHEAGSLAEALAKYQEAAKNAPGDPAIKTAMQSVLDDISARKKEADALKKRIEALLTEAENLRQQGKLTGALAKFKDVQMVAPDHPGLKTRMHDLETEIAAKAAAARKEAEKRQLTLRTGTLVASAEALRRDGDVARALAKYEEAHQLMPSYPGIPEAIEQLKKDIAAAVLARKRDALRRQVDGMLAEIRSHIQAGRYANAIDKCDEALRLEPAKPQADSLAILRRQAVSDEKARKNRLALRGQEVAKARSRAESLMAHAADLCESNNGDEGITKYEAAAAICAKYPELKSLSDDIKKRIEDTKAAEKKRPKRPRAH